jgi:hypothetical protein
VLFFDATVSIPLLQRAKALARIQEERESEKSAKISYLDRSIRTGEDDTVASPGGNDVAPASRFIYDRFRI